MVANRIRESIERTADSWRLVIHQDIQDALEYLTPDEIRDTVAFALAEGMEDQSQAARATQQFIRDEYKRLCRADRKGEYHKIPEWLKDHLWDVRVHVEEMGLPEEFQYHPITDAMQGRRTEAIAEWGGSEYEKSLGI